MKAVIMAGGFGTRMRPLTINLPKPMIPMVNRPIMAIIVDLLKKHKLTDLISVVFYQSEFITEYFRDGTDFGVKMQYKAAESDLGTAGSVKNCQAMIEKERFVVISGDVLTDFDLSEAIAFHEKNKAQATMILTGLKTPSLSESSSWARMEKSNGSLKSRPGVKFSPTPSIRVFTFLSPRFWT